MMLPGMPLVVLPVTPDILLLPLASVSAVLVHVGWASAASKEEVKSPPLAVLGDTRAASDCGVGVLTFRGLVSAGLGGVGLLGETDGDGDGVSAGVFAPLSGDAAAAPDGIARPTATAATQKVSHRFLNPCVRFMVELPTLLSANMNACEDADRIGVPTHKRIRDNVVKALLHHNFL
jgi:hypothetical protein